MKTIVRNEFVPNVFLIGAQKSGTTYLAALLAQSKDICLSDPKESHFFSTNYEMGWDYYSKCFKKSDRKFLIDASTTYTFLCPANNLNKKEKHGLLDPVPKRIYNANPDAVFIYIMRDPIERIKSACLHRRHAGIEDNTKIDLAEIINQEPMLDLISRYSDQIERYLEYFSNEKFIFLDFKELVSEPIATTRKVCDFIGAECSEISEKDAESEMHSRYRATYIRRFVNIFSDRLPKTKRLVKNIGKKVGIDAQTSMFGKKPLVVEFSNEDIVRRSFAEEVIKIKALTGVDLRS